jgi:hypothetical protein
MESESMTLTDSNRSLPKSHTGISHPTDSLTSPAGAAVDELCHILARVVMRLTAEQQSPASGIEGGAE